MSNTKHNTNDASTAHQGLNCSLCLYCDTCDHDEPCEYLAPTDDDAYTDQLMDELRSTVIPFPARRLGKGKSDKNATYDGIDTTYHFYRKIINECLDDIRRGRIAYVYKKEHVAEILRFEPDINVVHKDGIFYISL